MLPIYLQPVAVIKKRHWHLQRPARRHGWPHPEVRSESLVCGYKKHSFRLWWRPYERAVLMLPLVSWVAPANVYEGAFLVPSLRHCDRRWSWWPRYVVADMGYVSAQLKKRCRENWQVAVLTHLRADINLCAPFQSERQARVHKGSRSDGSAMIHRISNIGLPSANTLNFAYGAGKLASVPGNLRMRQQHMRRCWGCCL